MASRYKKVSEEEVNAYKTAAENPSIRKSILIKYKVFANLHFPDGNVVTNLTQTSSFQSM